MRMPQVRSARTTHHDHMRRWLADLASGNFDDRVYYFEVLPPRRSTVAVRRALYSPHTSQLRPEILSLRGEGRLRTLLARRA